MFCRKKVFPSAFKYIKNGSVFKDNVSKMFVKCKVSLNFISLYILHNITIIKFNRNRSSI